MADNEDKDSDNINAADETAGTGTSGKSGKSGKSGGGIRLPPNQLKEVTGNWEYLDATKVAARVAEFFGEGVAKASAHAVVVWDSAKQGFSVVMQFLKWGQDKGREIAYLMQNLTRENAEILRARYGMNIGPAG